jgi:hypothetical protein
MQRDDLKRWQARKLHQAISPSVGYFSRLQSRMEKRGFLGERSALPVSRQGTGCDAASRDGAALSFVRWGWTETRRVKGCGAGTMLVEICGALVVHAPLY